MSVALLESIEPRLCLSAVTGTEFAINTTTLNVQQATGSAVIASQSNGDFVAVWESLGQDLLGTWGIYGRRYFADGTPKGPEFLINAGSVLNNQRQPSVAVGPAGDFVVSWQGENVGGILPSIIAQRFTSAGAAEGGEITVALGTLLQAKSNAVVAMSTAGQFIVAWESTSQDSLLTSGIYARVYGPTGTALTTEFLVNQTTAGDQVLPSVAAESSGNFLIAWSGQGTGDGTGVFLRRFTSAGAALSGELRVNTTTGGSQAAPSLAVAPSGDVVIAWEGAGTGDGTGIFLQRFDGSLAAIGGETLVNDVTPGTQAEADLAFDPDGDLMVTWSGSGTGDADGIYAREFASNGTARGTSMLVNTTVATSQLRPSVTSRGDNDYVVTWSGAGAGDVDGVFGRLLANERPVVVTTPGALAYTENWGPTVVDAGLTIADNDHLLLAGAIVAITGNYAPGEDLLEFTNQLGITGSWDAASGVLTLSGAATLAAYQAALRTVTYRNTSDGPSTSSRTVSFTVSDGSDDSAAANRTVTVTPVNDRPTVTATGASLNYAENDGAVGVDPGLTVTDVDNASLVGATVTISGNYTIGEDLLEFVAQGGITATWDAINGVLTLSGTATVAAYQAALRAVTYRNTSEQPSPLSRTISFVVDDGTEASLPAARTLSIGPVNDAPVLAVNAVPLSYLENAGAVAVDPGLTLTDVDSLMLSGATVIITGNYVEAEDLLEYVAQGGIAGTWDPTTGMLTLSGTATPAAYQAALRAVMYRNTSDEPSTLARTISFVVDDGLDASTPAARAVAVTASNDAPLVVSGGTLTYTENDGAIAIDPTLTVSDVDNATLTGATIRIATNYALGEDVLGFTPQNGITGLWDAPTATLTLSGVASVAAYETALRSVTYLNSSDDPATTTRTVSFVVRDTEDSNTASRSVTISATNDAPVVLTTSSALDYTENSGVLPVDSGLSIADLDSPTLTSATVTINGNYDPTQDLLTFVDQAGITGSWDSITGILTLSGTALLSAYQAALRTVGYSNSSDDPSTLPRSIAFTVSDGLTSSAADTRTINVGAANDAPVITTTSGSVSFVENSSPLAIDPTLSITDPDNTTLTGATVSISNNYVSSQDVLGFVTQAGITGSWDVVTGILTLSGTASGAAYQAALRSVTYLNTSESPSTLPRTVAFVVSDGTDPSTPASRTVTVFSVDDVPLVTATATSLNYSENAGPIVIDPGVAVVDLDSASLTGAAITIAANYISGQDVLGVTPQAGIVALWNASTGVLTLSGTASVAAYQAALRSVTYANTSDDPSPTARTITFSVTDGANVSIAAARTVTVVPSNDAPALSTSVSLLDYLENSGSAFVDSSIVVSDVDSTTLFGATVTILTSFRPSEDSLTFTPQGGITGLWNPSTGVLTLSGAASIGAYQAVLRSVAYLNNSDDPLISARTISFTVNDGADTSPAALRTVVVGGINDLPLIQSAGNSRTYTENAPGVIIEPLLTLLDLDNLLFASASVTISENYAPGQDILTLDPQTGITSSWDPASARLTLTGLAPLSTYQAALRSVRFANASENPSPLTRTLTILVNDGFGPSLPVTSTVQVIAVNDAPVITTGLSVMGYAEGAGALVVDGGLTISDVDSDVIAGARMAISSNFASDDEALAFDGHAGITGVWDAFTGVLTLSGDASIADYIAALRSVTYLNSSEVTIAASKSITIQIIDDLGLDASASLTLSFAGVNDAPVIGMTRVVLNYQAAGSPVVIDPAILVTDIDTPELVGATVALVEGYVPLRDELKLDAQQGITATWDPSTGVLTLSGNATVAAYQEALRNVRFRTSALGPSAIPAAIEFAVDDGEIRVTGAWNVGVVIPAPPVIPDPDPDPIPDPDPTPIPIPDPVPLPDPTPDPTPTPTPEPSPTPDPQPNPVPNPIPDPTPIPTPVIPGPSVPANDGTPVTPVPVVPGPDLNVPDVTPLRPALETGAVSVAVPQLPGQPPLALATIQLVDLTVDRSVDGGTTELIPTLGTRITTAIVEVSGTLGAGYVVWLLLNYSLARHSLFLLPKFDPLDLHCLLTLSRRGYKLAA